MDIIYANSVHQHPWTSPWLQVTAAFQRPPFAPLQVKAFAGLVLVFKPLNPKEHWQRHVCAHQLCQRRRCIKIMTLLIFPLTHRMQPKFWKNEAAAANQRVLRPIRVAFNPHIHPDPRGVTVWKIMVSINCTFNPGSLWQQAVRSDLRSKRCRFHLARKGVPCRLHQINTCWRLHGHPLCQLLVPWQLWQRPAHPMCLGTRFRRKGSPWEVSWGLPSQDISKAPRKTKDPVRAPRDHTRWVCILPQQFSRNGQPLQGPRRTHRMKNPAPALRALDGGHVDMAWCRSV